jgi:DNA-binding protein YbaB
MSGPLPRPADVTDPLEKMSRLMAAAVGGQAPQHEVRGVGHGGQERVSAEVSAGGRLEALSIDPLLARVGVEAIAQYVIDAVRAAQEDAERQVADALAAAGGVDTQALSRQLGDVAVEATRGFDRMLADLDGVLRRLDRR